ncbi:hypothetical protein ACFL35_03240 [Candidatus Riflebacteria bacterium]
MNSGKRQKKKKSHLWLVLNNPLLRDYTPPLLSCPGSKVVAINGGLLPARRWGLNPDLFIGDMDSVPEVNAQLATKRWSSKKNASDFELFFTEFGNEFKNYKTRISGLFGGRHDHEFINLKVLFGQKFIYPTFLDGPDYTALFLNSGNYEISVELEKTFSLLFNSIPLEISLSGCYYPISQAFDLDNQDKIPASLFLSNKTKDDKLCFSFKSDSGIILYFPEFA